MADVRRVAARMLFAAGVAIGPTQIARAADGPVVVWFSAPAADVSDKLAILCADREANVIEQDDRHVLCQREVSGGKGILAQALLGNSSSTSPQLNIRFSILRDQGAVRVQASQWIELQMAMGQTRRTELGGTKNRTQLEDLLIAQGAHSYPPSLDAAPAPEATTARPVAPAPTSQATPAPKP